MGEKHLQFCGQAVGEKTRGSQRPPHYAELVTVIQPTEDTSVGVVLPLPMFRLLPGEALGPGLKRLGISEVDAAISGFYDGEEVFRDAVHSARKSMKRIRALLRLIRFEIGERAYRFENLWIRDTARLIAPVRDAAVMVDAITEMRGMYGPMLAEGTFEELEEKLVVRRDRSEERAMEDPGLLPVVVANLERARSRYESWPTDPEARRLYGSGIRDDYEAVRAGLVGTYRRGRREMVSAYQSPSPAHFHLWRKRSKYLKHQFEILTRIWPEMMIGMAITLDRVAELLGKDHDLAELLQLVSDRPDLCPDPLERSLINALAQQHRSDLETASRILGRRIFVEHPAALDKRLAAYWESLDMARTVVLPSLIA